GPLARSGDRAITGWRNRATTRQPGATGQPAWVAELFEQFRASEIETWNEETWEAVTLESLWRVCRDGVRGLPEFTAPAPTLIRHRDLLLQVTGIDIDLQVNSVLIPFCAAFVDQGVAQWSLPDREEGFFQAFARLYRRPGGSPERWQIRLRDEL